MSRDSRLPATDARIAAAEALRAFEAGTEYYNRTGAEEFRAALAAGPLLMQGPMGSMLMGEPHGLDIPAACWNIDEPQTVEQLHRLYVAAGASVTLTNTFQASAPALARDRISVSVAEVNRMGVDAARAARPQAVVGSIGPCGPAHLVEETDTYAAAYRAYREQAHALLAAGADALMLETFTSLADFAPAVQACIEVADGMPILASFAVAEEGKLIAEDTPIESAVLYAEEHGAAAVGVNCCSLEAASAAVSRMVGAATTPVMVRPNAGAPELVDGELVWHEDPEAFARACTSWLEAGARLVGSCCGTTPRTTARMFDALDAWAHPVPETAA